MRASKIFRTCATRSALAALLGTSALPASTVVLTTEGASGVINGAIYQQLDDSRSGSDSLNVFLNMQQAEFSDFEQGYNTDARPVEFDENPDPALTRSIRLGDVPLVEIAGTMYREFVLDTQEPDASEGDSTPPFLSIDRLQLFLTSSPGITGYTGSGFGGSAVLVYDMDGLEDSYVKLLDPLGTALGNMLLYVPDSLFAPHAAANEYVVLFSRFGDTFAAEGAAEQWGVRMGGGSAAVPEPGTMALIGSALVALRFLRRSRTS